MSRRNKLEKFEAINSMPNVYQNFDFEKPQLSAEGLKEVKMRGQWSAEHFGNNNKLVLELACGRGEYSIGLGKMFPEKNFVGIDIKGARIHTGAIQAIEENMTNVAFLRTKIEQCHLFFDAGEVDEIWITFPDPFLKERKRNRRLTSPPFLDIYRKILKKGGTIHLKTDSPVLFEYSLNIVAKYPHVELIECLHDVHNKSHKHEELSIPTYYERLNMAKGEKINYLNFKLN